jgi:hypothetical protein
MTYDRMNQIYVNDVFASDLQLPVGRWPLVVTYEDREWIQDVPKFGPEADLEAYHYVPREDADFPMVLCIWND